MRIQKGKQVLSLNIIQNNWKDCTKCRSIGKVARNKVFFDKVTDFAGSQCDILMIGEGPGTVEDIKGIPFSGPAGKLLRQIIEDSNPNCPKCQGIGTYEKLNMKTSLYSTETCFVCKGEGNLRIGLTNLLLCRPFARTPYATGNRSPTPLEVKNCMPRLLDMITVTNPTIIVTVGEEVRNYLTEIRAQALASGLLTMPSHMVHPAFLLRRNETNLAFNGYHTEVLNLKKVFQICWHIIEMGYYKDENKN